MESIYIILLFLLHLICFINTTNDLIQDLLDIEDQKCYAVALDAGSSGTRANIYNIDCFKQYYVPNLDYRSSEVQKQKEFPRLAQFQTKVNLLKVDLFMPIFNYLNSIIESPKTRKRTPIMLGATAGMRLLTPNQQQYIINESITILSQSEYYFPNDPKEQKKWCQIITGPQEGAYLWLNMNYLLGNLNMENLNKQNTVTTIDIGGASSQVAFVPIENRVEKNNQNMDMDIILEKMDYKKLRSYTFLGFGVNQARYNIIKSVISNSENINLVQNKKNNEKINVYFPCANNGQKIKLPENHQIYAVSNASDSAKFLKFKREFKMQDYYEKLEYLYQMNWQQVNLQFWGDKNLYEKVFNAAYVYTLLQEVYNLKYDQIVNVPDRVDTIYPGWDLSYLMIRIGNKNSQHDKNYHIQDPYEN
ncbi:nucleoside phosphatase family protein, putative [Ichthyophthirius multifiliis]|uniref:Nucleoside phosphatase family protein, putative n=1 Tax=Ichthyophthirius multifiliis TaxID=5932 RepID=G0QZ59_ICHMU|nr:nucleoside phosphatase family protein, putative [Ichthyophthirius multifiliis]EGR29482.1 nucleoside phosphatase family protein, putative [Ichthyophthirius multifiliis]|eukprot:XP_004030718.1 nucleoside phosphatase family protein, putative [Ichthyophthirius multifiliis]